MICHIPRAIAVLAFVALVTAIVGCQSPTSSSAAPVSSPVPTATPASTVPAAPTGLVATPWNSEVTLSWNPSATATAYKVYYKVGTSASVTDTLVSTAMVHGTTAAITGLTNATGYAFAVVATNAKGDSPVSASVTATPQASLATVPQLIAVGSLAGTTDLSGLTYTLENGNPASILGGLGSGLAWAGGNTFLAVPDRGPNAVVYDATVDNTTAYINRFHTIQMSLTAVPANGLPYTVVPTLANTTLLNTSDPLNYGPHYNDGTIPALTALKALNTVNAVNYFTGRSDGFGSGDSGNPLDSRLDPESIRVSNDGKSVYISDEYGPYVYQFDRVTGKRLKSYSLPAHFYVTSKSPLGATEISGNTVGRVANKGMEGLAISPDGSTLVGFIQSPLIQDGGDGGAANRIVTIDVASGATHEYVYDNRINGTTYNSSEIVAVNSHEFLVDERDGKGLGSGNSAVIKKLFKIDITGATDVSTLSGEANLLPYSVNKTLFLDLVPALNGAGITAANIPSKIEGLAFGSDITVAGVTKHTLWVANDNDFVPGASGPNVFYVFAVADSDLQGSQFVPQSVAPLTTTAVSVTGLSLSPGSLTLVPGAVASLTPVVTPANAGNKALSWTSDNKAVATVDGGSVTAVSAGTANISATTVDGSFKASVTVKVSIAVSGVSLPPTLSLPLNSASVPLTAVLAPANATDINVTWKSLDETVAKVLNGLVTPQGVGSTNITVTTEDGNFSAVCSVTVSASGVAVTGVTLDQHALALVPGGVSASLNPSVLPAGATNPAVKWASDNNSVASVINGVVTSGGSTGTATITVTTADHSFTDTCLVTVGHGFLGFTSTGLLSYKVGVAGTWIQGDSSDAVAAGSSVLVASTNGTTFYGFDSASGKNGQIYQKTGLLSPWTSVGSSTASGTMKAAAYDGTNFYGFTATGKYNTKVGVSGTWAAANVGGTTGLSVISVLFDGTTFWAFQANGSLYSNTLTNAAAAGAFTATDITDLVSGGTLVSVTTDGTNYFGITNTGLLFEKTGNTGAWTSVATNASGVTLGSVTYN